jgi:hypothetical protein
MAGQRSNIKRKGECPLTVVLLPNIMFYRHNGNILQIAFTLLQKLRATEVLTIKPGQ